MADAPWKSLLTKKDERIAELESELHHARSMWGLCSDEAQDLQSRVRYGERVRLVVPWWLRWALEPKAPF